MENVIENLLAEFATKNNERLKLNEQAAKLDEESKAILAKLESMGVGSGTYGRFQVATKTKQVPRATEWANVWKYIRDNNAFDLLHKRLTETAVMARINEGEHIPGIVTDDKVTYKITAA